MMVLPPPCANVFSMPGAHQLIDKMTTSDLDALLAWLLALPSCIELYEIFCTVVVQRISLIYDHFC
jgi:hypothetical protein